jgi:subtilisin family serine protease
MTVTAWRTGSRLIVAVAAVISMVQAASGVVGRGSQVGASQSNSRAKNQLGTPGSGPAVGKAAGRAKGQAAAKAARQAVRDGKLIPGVTHKPDELIVRFAPESNGTPRSQNSQNALLREVEGATVKRQLPPASDLGVVQLSPGSSIEEAMATLKRNKGILYVQPNYRYYVEIMPDDPRFSELWGMHNTGQTGGTSDADIDAPEAWDIHTGDGSVIVAVIDTGVDYTHPDLAANVWVNNAELNGQPGVDDDQNGFVDDIHGYDFVNGDGDPMDDVFHGTHCAGTIGARGDNGIGVAGVCWNAKIMAVKFLDADGSGFTDDAILGIHYAVANGAKVLSNSWGGYRYDQALKDAIDWAGQAGVLFVAAAGNDAFDNDSPLLRHYPSSYASANVIAVMATDSNDHRAYFSNYGATTVDIGAPGLGILSTFPTHVTQAMQDEGFSADYGTISGTSMATPHVAGACALLWSANHALTSAMVKSTLLDTVDPALSGLCASGGRLNVYQALAHTASPRGRVFLERDWYSCSGTVGVLLADRDLAGSQTRDVVLSTTDGDSETLTLSESPANSGLLHGTMQTSGAAVIVADGILQAADGGTITVTYQDTDDGTGNPATATDTAGVDCVLPVISGTQVTVVPAPVTVTFQTDEPAIGVVWCGLTCGGPGTVVNQDSAPTTSHTIRLKGLNPNTQYFCIVEAYDRAENVNTDSNGSTCYAFDSPYYSVPDGYATIQAAIDAAPERAEIMVRDGVYTGDGNVFINFGGKALTLRSENGPDSTVIDCEGTHQAFYFLSGETPDTVVEGLRIINGMNATGGGAVYCDYDSAPTLRNCVFERNRAPVWGIGGAVWSFASSPAFEDCVFLNNEASDACGAVWCNAGGQPQFKRCLFYGNRASYAGAIGFGGTDGRLIDCILIGNHSRTSGGAVGVGGNAGLMNCRIADNSAGRGGGGVFYWGDVGQVGATLSISNSVLSGNKSADQGGAYIGPGGPSSLSSTVRFTNCAVVNNSAVSTGGAIVADDSLSLTTIENSILWGNTAADGAQAAVLNSAELDITHSDVQSGRLGVRLETGATLNWGAGNIDNDPGFFFRDDYHLKPTSPCIDAGTDSPSGGLADTDFDGETRQLDGNGDQNAVPDMGPFEFNPQRPCLAVSPPFFGFLQPVNGSSTYTGEMLVQNCGSGTLAWAISESCPWLTLDPLSGQSTHEFSSVAVSANTAGASRGLYVSRPSIGTPGAARLSTTVPVILRVSGELHVPSEFATIQAAVDAANDGDVIVLADGTYTGTGNKEVEFAGKAVTVRSANGPTTTTIDCEGSGSAFHLRMAEGRDSVIQGLTIVNASTSGIHCEMASPTITGCIVRNCSGGAYGGGIWCGDSTALISDCVIHDNSVPYGGGGVCVWSRSRVTVRRSSIYGNTAASGGGLYCWNLSSLELVDCTIHGNLASFYGGGICFEANQDDTSNSLSCINCRITYNRTTSDSDGFGGGVYVDGGQATIVNSTVSDNSVLVGKGGGVGIQWGGNVTLVNSIAWFNQAPHGRELAVGYLGQATVSYSDLSGGRSAVYVFRHSVLNWGSGNIKADPQFVDRDGPDNDLATWEDNDLRLTVQSPYSDAGGPGRSRSCPTKQRLKDPSPCIDAGDNSAVPSAVTTDLAGNPRFLDETTVRDTGNGTSPIVDMGAYEGVLTATKWRSVRTHGSTGEWPVDLDPSATGNGTCGPTVEPRQYGIQKVEVDFNHPIQITGMIEAEDVATNTMYSAASVSIVNGSTLVVQFNSGVLPDRKCYRINLAGKVGSDPEGLAMAGDTDCLIRSLTGDVNGDGATDLADMNSVKSELGVPVTAETANFDVTVDGMITKSDLAFVKSLNGTSATCP